MAAERFRVRVRVEGAERFRVRVRVGLRQGQGLGFGLGAERFRVRVRVREPSVGRLQEWHDCTLAGELSDAVLHGKGGLGLAAHDWVVGHMPLVVGSRAIESREHHRRLRRERRSVRRGRERRMCRQQRGLRTESAVRYWCGPTRGEKESAERAAVSICWDDGGSERCVSASFGAM